MLANVLAIFKTSILQDQLQNTMKIAVNCVRRDSKLYNAVLPNDLPSAL